MNTVPQLRTVKGNTSSKVSNELSRTGGLLRVAPAWVPRSFLQPGLRIKLHPDDTYAYGLNRGGIDERWFASPTWPLIAVSPTASVTLLNADHPASRQSHGTQFVKTIR
jgi:hypothetical protein